MQRLSPVMRYFLALAAISMLWLAGCKPDPTPWFINIPNKYEKLVNDVIRNAGENAGELRRFLAYYDNDKKALEAASFLVANLPLADAASLSAADLREHIDYAFIARNEMPWGKEVPWDTFLHFVITHRGSGEPLQNWRRTFYNELAPVVSKCKTMNEAAVEVNKWCLMKASYESRSEWWDQGPLTTILRGWGRCEEEMILFIAAARSVCLPARQCSAPYWQHSDNNHAWVETWVDGKWAYLGACEPAMTLNSAWFSGPTKTAALVVSAAYGEMEKSDEPILRHGKGYTIINSTAVYTTPCDIDVTVLDENGKPLEEATVFFSIYNFACLRHIASLKTDKHGKVSMVIGRGTFLVSTAVKGVSDYDIVYARPDEPHSITLDLRRNRVAEGNFWMRFGTGPRSVQGTGVEAVSAEAFRLEIANINKARAARTSSYKKQVAAFLSIAEDDPEAWKDPFAKAMADSAGNCSEVIRALSSVSAENYDVLKRYISEMNFRDLLETTGPALLTDLEYALAARTRLADLGQLEYDDNTFYSFVLNNRIARECWSSWRGELATRFSAYIEDDLMVAVARVNEYTALLDSRKRTIFGGMMNPVEIVRCGAVNLEEERAGMAVAMLRAIGIPAKYLRQWGMVQFFNGSEWLPFYPNEPANLGVKTATASAGTIFADPATLELTFTKDGKPMVEDKCHYGRDFSICRFLPEGYFGSIELEGEFDETSLCHKLTVPEGKYYIFAGVRNSIGEPYVQLIPVDCVSGGKITMSIALDLPEDVGLPIVRNLGSFPALSGTSLDGLQFDLSGEVAAGKKVVVVFFDTDSEPSINMLPKIAALPAQENVSVVAVCSASSIESARTFVSKYCGNLVVLFDEGGQLSMSFQVAAYPSILVLGKDGRIELWSEGHFLEITSLIERALSQ